MVLKFLCGILYIIQHLGILTAALQNVAMQCLSSVCKLLLQMYQLHNKHLVIEYRAKCDLSRFFLIVQIRFYHINQLYVVYSKNITVNYSSNN